MATLSRILAADVGGPQLHKAHNLSSYTLAAATPLAIISSKDGFLQRVADLGLAVAIPVHMHIGLNACVTDYLPKVARGPARAGLLAGTAICTLGLLKINLTGPGITQTVKGLWNKGSAK
mmetsp:Transcript_27677/g.70494  ORF Transcript_27677/g.70494 Transcript_27677/m.70494 type:complete len:120 (-) Transcript_27677:396-755(-)|eukprot:CAMPEP_0202865946 /NCGR_PEP_ID=MMETSP1391-20130828/6758_1 /ASSEMBLY_ACC=CAM_ASM_000867 /TAXON_ID=1034604 /ORGANISM="Chlamydomonas leiostraca, Strain SAG 11-49" /LENGTH=119 /DNA_ID=CAMNT_0049545837 /DNA_START=135 /DNA_END=494 /DNA_ORIENTATION=-